MQVSVRAAYQIAKQQSDDLLLKEVLYLLGQAMEKLEQCEALWCIDELAEHLSQKTGLTLSIRFRDREVPYLQKAIAEVINCAKANPRIPCPDRDKYVHP